jgi:NOL1/NOP2/fmu family ribosome biogenesis protein
MVEKILKEIRNRFGIPEEVFSNWKIVEAGDLWIMSEEAFKFPIKNFSRKGIRLVRVYRDGYKLTTAGIQIFGKYATKNVLEISPEQVKDYLEGKDLSVGSCNVENGQVIIKYGDDYLGSGLYVNGKVKNQLPKGRRWY